MECKYKAYNGWCNWHKRGCNYVNSKQCPYKRPYTNPKTNEGKSFKYYAIEYSVSNGEYMYFDNDLAQYTVVKALSLINAKKQLSRKYDYYGDSDYSSVFVSFGDIKEFTNKKEAESYIKLRKE